MIAPKVSEHSEQARVIDWAREHERKYPCLKWLFAIPNGAKLPYSRSRKGKRFAPQAVKLKTEGMRSGVADLLLPYACQGWHGLFIEMKIGDNKPTDNQKEFLKDMNEAGYLAMVCWGADNAIVALRMYLGDMK